VCGRRYGQLPASFRRLLHTLYTAEGLLCKFVVVAAPAADIGGFNKAYELSNYALAGASNAVAVCRVCSCSEMLPTGMHVLARQATALIHLMSSSGSSMPRTS
jgi:hypothetical protein